MFSPETGVIPTGALADPSAGAGPAAPGKRPLSRPGHGAVHEDLIPVPGVPEYNLAPARPERRPIENLGLGR